MGVCNIRVIVVYDLFALFFDLLLDELFYNHRLKSLNFYFHQTLGKSLFGLVAIRLHPFARQRLNDELRVEILEEGASTKIEIEVLMDD